MTDKLIASTIRFTSATSDVLSFNLKTEGDTVIDTHCRPCTLKQICNGEKSQRSGSGRINLRYPIAQNLTSEQAQNVPCGVGIEVIQRRPSLK